MSEMRIEIKDDADFGKAMEAYWKMRGYSDLEKVRAALKAYVPKTERAIAEAVAAERERVLKEVEDRADAAIPGQGADIAFSDLCKILEAIRSAAK